MGKQNERDWAADWDWTNDPNVCISERVQGMLVYWLQQVKELEEENRRLRDILREIAEVMQESEGIAGWHLNGDVAAWNEFEFLTEIEQALASPASKKEEAQKEERL